MKKVHKGFKYQNKCQLCKKTFSATEKIIYCADCREKIETSKKEEKVKEQERIEKRIRIKEKGPETKLGYKFELFSVNSSSLSKFVFPDNRRKLSKSQLASLTKSIYEEVHFDSPIVVNEKDDLYRVIDGNHRIETIKKILKIHPKFKIDVLLIKYKNLDDDGEIGAFHKWNVGKQQSIDDFIQSIKDKVPFILWVTKSNFPIKITIYKTRNSLPIKLLCNAISSVNRGDDEGRGLYRKRLLESMQEFTEEDYNKAASFCKGFKHTFGEPHPKNVYYKYGFFFAVMYITYEYNDKDLWNKFREIIGDEQVLEYINYTNAKANRKLLSIIKEKIKLPMRL